MPFDEHLARRIRTILSQQPGVEEKRMFGGLAFLVNGRMSCGIVGKDLVVRVGPDSYQQVLSQPHARPMDFTGRPLRGFVYVGPSACRSPAQLRAWIQRGLRFARSLPPKPYRR